MAEHMLSLPLYALNFVNPKKRINKCSLQVVQWRHLNALKLVLRKRFMGSIGKLELKKKERDWCVRCVLVFSRLIVNLSFG